MKARIYFKDSVNRSPVVVEELIDIKATSLDTKIRSKNYTKENFAAFAPFAQESYSFSSSNGVISVSGADILYVELLED